MAGNGGGVIINLSSMVATVGLPGGAAYGATKAALVAMTRSWAAEYGASGVRVNAVAPGPVYTEGAKNTVALGKTTLLNRAAQPEEIAETIAFLASPRATEELARVWARDGAYAGPEQRRRPGVAAQVAVPDDLITAPKQGRLPKRRELRILLAGYSCHPDFDPQWSELARD
jgi:Enoyl-(Acyl carrier protein) reductase